MSIDYSKLEEITVKSQEELDMIPDDFVGRIYIEFGAPWDKAVVNKRYKKRVVARGNSSVEARGNSSVEAWENSSVVARGNSSVEARENSSVEARGNSSVVARENSSVVAWENSSVEAWENSSVEARGNSSVVAWENSSVEANANVQVVDRLKGGKIEITGNARIVYMPKTIEDYCAFYGIKHDKRTGRFFKAVHKGDRGYFSDKDYSFVYTVGEKAVADYLDKDTSEDCGHGIHISYLAWAIDYGNDWKDLAILEVEAKLDGIVLPDECPGKVRCAEVTVVREVPLKECGIYGKILAKRMKA